LPVPANGFSITDSIILNPEERRDVFTANTAEEPAQVAHFLSITGHIEKLTFVISMTDSIPVPVIVRSDDHFLSPIVSSKTVSSVLPVTI
jgi:hypothetical protein